MFRVRLSTLAVALLAILSAQASLAATVAMVAPASQPTTCFGSTSGTQYNPQPGATVQVDTRDQQSAFNCGYVMANSVPIPNAVGAPFQQKPLTALISHSFALRTVTQFIPATSVQVTNSATGAVTFAIPNFATGLTSLAAGNIIRLYGSGTVFDGYYKFVSGVAGTSVSATGAVAVGQPLGTTVFTVPLGVAKLHDMGSGGSTGGYSGNWHSILRMTTGDGFQLPPSYVFGFNGGLLVPNAGAGDPGLPGWITAVLAKSPLPTFVTIDLGVNDIYASQSAATLLAMKQTLIAGAQQLRAKGIVPQVCPILGAGTTASGWTLAMSEAAKAHNRTILELARQGLILTFDPMKRLMNPADTNGLGFARNYDSTVNPVVHLSPNGGLEVAHQAALSLYGGLLQPAKLLSNNPADAFASPQNPYGSIMPVVSGLLTGVITGTAASANITSSSAQIGTSNIYAQLFNSANLPATTNVTSQIAARVDKWPDGTTVEGSEIIVTFPAGVYGGRVGAFFSPGSTGALLAGTAYTAGDVLQPTAEVEVDSTNLGNAETIQIPLLNLVEADGAGDNQINDNVFNDAASPALNTGSGPLLAGVYTLTGITLQTRTVANAGSNSSNVQPQLLVYVSGTVTGGITFRIRGWAVNKIDPTVGEPFFVPPSAERARLRAANDELCEPGLDLACGMY